MNKIRIASLFQRLPWVHALLFAAYRRIQPRFTGGVVGVLRDDSGRVLLVKHVYHLSDPWGLPGGWLGRGEDPARAIEREFQEETGLAVRAVRPVLVQIEPTWKGHLDMAYLMEADHLPERLTLSGELLEYGWFAPDALPPLRLFHRQVLEALRQKQG